MAEKRRNLVRRHRDGRMVNVARPRGHLFVCHNNCCCGRTEDGFAAVPVDYYQRQWEQRRLRNFVHLTVGGCLGPCALANVAMLLIDGQTLWFHSMDQEEPVSFLFDYIESLLEAGTLLPVPNGLAARHFSGHSWQLRPDGAPVDDLRPWPGRAARRDVLPTAMEPAPACAAEPVVERLIADMQGEEAAPRRNGELVFEQPWMGRAFGLAVALSDQLYDWEEFRANLIAEIGAADQRGDYSGYYERWLAAFERTLSARGILSPGEIDERAYQFEFGERDDVF